MAQSVGPPRLSTTQPIGNLFTPPIPQPAQNNQNMLACLVALKSCVESLTGQRGEANNRAVTFRDLVQYGILDQSAVTSPRGSFVGGGGGNQNITLSGDVTGAGTTAVTTTAVGLQGRHVAVTAPGDQQVLTWSTSANSWQPATPTGGGSGGGGATISATPPLSPVVGQLWWDSVGGQLFTWYTDPSSSQWVIANSITGGEITGDIVMDCGDF